LKAARSVKAPARQRSCQASAIPLAPGQHFIRLRNPSYVTEDRAVQVSPGQTVWIDVDLRRRPGEAPGAR